MTALSRTRRRVRRRIAGWRIQSPSFDRALRQAGELTGMGRADVLPVIHASLLIRLARARAWSGLTGSPLVYEAARRRVLADLASLGIYSPVDAG